MGVKLITEKDGYFLYRVGDYNELWRGKMGVENSYRAGYVQNPENIDMAIAEAEAEMRSLIADWKKYG